MYIWMLWLVDWYNLMLVWKMILVLSVCKIMQLIDQNQCRSHYIFFLYQSWLLALEIYFDVLTINLILIPQLKRIYVDNRETSRNSLQTPPSSPVQHRSPLVYLRVRTIFIFYWLEQWPSSIKKVVPLVHVFCSDSALSPY